MKKIVHFSFFHFSFLLIFFCVFSFFSFFLWFFVFPKKCGDFCSFLFFHVRHFFVFLEKNCVCVCFFLFPRFFEIFVLSSHCLVIFQPLLRIFWFFSFPATGTPLRRTPLRRDPPPPDLPSAGPPKISRFFFPLPLPCSLFFSLSEGLLVEFWWCFWRPGNLNVHVWALEPENSKRAHSRVAALQTPPNFHEKTPSEREREKERKLECGEGKKSAKFWASPPSGPHPSNPHAAAPDPSGSDPSDPNPWGPNFF